VRQIEVLAGGRSIPSGVSLRLHAGQLCGLIGPSGLDPGLRARVKTRVKVKLLLDGRVEETEFKLFFRRSSLADPWFMILDDSLRQLDVDREKKH